MTKTCAIISGGPSLANEDLSRINVPKIGINLSFVATTSQYHVFTAKDLFDSHGEMLHRLTPNALRFGTWYAKGVFRPDQKGFYSMSNVPGLNLSHVTITLPEDYNIYEIGHGWMLAGGSPCALQVAVSFGFNEIIFCGLDLGIGKDSKIHFYPEAFDNMVDIGDVTLAWREQSYLKQLDFLQKFQPELERRKIKLYNTSLNSLEQLYEKVVFKDMFG